MADFTNEHFLELSNEDLSDFKQGLSNCKSIPELVELLATLKSIYPNRFIASGNNQRYTTNEIWENLQELLYKLSKIDFTNPPTLTSQMIVDSHNKNAFPDSIETIFLNLANQYIDDEMDVANVVSRANSPLQLVEQLENLKLTSPNCILRVHDEFISLNDLILRLQSLIDSVLKDQTINSEMELIEFTNALLPKAFHIELPKMLSPLIQESVVQKLPIEDKFEASLETECNSLGDLSRIIKQFLEDAKEIAAENMNEQTKQKIEAFINILKGFDENLTAFDDFFVNFGLNDPSFEYSNTHPLVQVMAVNYKLNYLGVLTILEPFFQDKIRNMRVLLAKFTNNSIQDLADLYFTLKNSGLNEVTNSAHSYIDINTILDSIKDCTENLQSTLEQIKAAGIHSHSLRATLNITSQWGLWDQFVKACKKTEKLLNESMQMEHPALSDIPQTMTHAFPQKRDLEEQETSSSLSEENNIPEREEEERQQRASLKKSDPKK